MPAMNVTWRGGTGSPPPPFLFARSHHKPLPHGSARGNGNLLDNIFPADTYDYALCPGTYALSIGVAGSLIAEVSVHLDRRHLVLSYDWANSISSVAIGFVRYHTAIKDKKPRVSTNVAKNLCT